MNITIITPLVFFVFSFIFSMLGMGGSQIYVPVLYWLGMDFKSEAIPLGMLLNVVSSTSASYTYWLKKLIDWKVAIPFGISMIVLAPAGTWLNINLPTKPIIYIFAIFTAIAALIMLSGWQPHKGRLSPKGRTILGLSGGGVLGFFAGLLGRGGGAFVVPLLVIAGLDAKIAAATSSFVISCSGISSFLSHILTAARPRVLIWAITVMSVFIGSQLGSRFMAEKLNPKKVKIIFGSILLVIAALLIIQNQFK